MAKDDNNGRKGGKDKRTQATVSKIHKHNKHRLTMKTSKAILKLETPPVCEQTNKGYKEGDDGSRASDRTTVKSLIKFEEGHGTSCASNKVKTSTSKFVEATTNG